MTNPAAAGTAAPVPPGDWVADLWPTVRRPQDLAVADRPVPPASDHSRHLGQASIRHQITAKEDHR
jgi:hypothetical protein